MAETLNVLGSDYYMKALFVDPKLVSDMGINYYFYMFYDLQVENHKSDCLERLYHTSLSRLLSLNKLKLLKQFLLNKL